MQVIQNLYHHPYRDSEAQYAGLCNVNDEVFVARQVCQHIVEGCKHFLSAQSPVITRTCSSYLCIAVEVNLFGSAAHYGVHSFPCRCFILNVYITVFSFRLRKRGFVISFNILFLKIPMRCLWSVVRVTPGHPSTNNLSFFKHHTTASASLLVYYNYSLFLLPHKKSFQLLRHENGVSECYTDSTAAAL